MNIYQHIAHNKQKTWVFLLVSFALVVGIGYLIQYFSGTGWEVTIIATAFALTSNFVSYFHGDKMALAMNGAKEIKKEDLPYLWNMVENLCISQGMPMPRVYVIHDDAMNAFATGRNPQKASVAFTTGIINGLQNEELEGVIAHELSHIQNYDTRLMTIVAAAIGVIMVMIDMTWRFGGMRSGDSDKKASPVLLVIGIALIILAPLIGQMIQLAISRKREFLADASGALMTRYPQGLANALQKISAQAKPLTKVNHGTAHLFISNPFGGEKMK
ncbi:M48 family metallopeptidase, partial [Candidatus Falkowbacteria bacterium]|nr:M48 family metallopeptidase [Candidatus Falkowbacteria bacterium]